MPSVFLGLPHVTYLAQCLELSRKGCRLEAGNQCELGLTPATLALFEPFSLRVRGCTSLVVFSTNQINEWWIRNHYNWAWSLELCLKAGNEGAGGEVWPGVWGAWSGGRGRGWASGAGWGGLLPERNPGLWRPEVEWLLHCGTGSCCGGLCLRASDVCWEMASAAAPAGPTLAPPLEQLRQLAGELRLLLPRVRGKVTLLGRATPGADFGSGGGQDLVGRGRTRAREAGAEGGPAYFCSSFCHHLVHAPHTPSRWSPGDHQGVQSGDVLDKTQWVPLLLGTPTSLLPFPFAFHLHILSEGVPHHTHPWHLRGWNKSIDFWRCFWDVSVGKSREGRHYLSSLCSSCNLILLALILAPASSPAAPHRWCSCESVKGSHDSDRSLLSTSTTTAVPTGAL